MSTSSADRPTRRATLRTAASAALALAVPSAVAHAAPWSPGRTTGKRSLIIAADQASRRVLLLDPNTTTLRGRRAALSTLASVWTWSPGTLTEFSDLQPELTWRNVSEAKWHVGAHRTWVLTCASDGFAAVVEYPGGRAYWAAAIPGNLHTMEVLPDGNIAVAASTGGFVRVYAASTGPRRTDHAEFALPGAHGLQWDPLHQVLWAVGDNHLVSLAISGTPQLPQITAVSTVPLPETGGHDLGTVALDPSRLWVTTMTHVRQFSLATRTFVSYSEQAAVDRPLVKSIGDDPLTGQILSVAPDTDNPCTWCTSTVRLQAPADVETLPGSSLYKARWAITL
ncbi:DUF6528 family protein [Streptomyces sp. H10-C2]|uniref:DUF6528 family protein n=1 Tax=unclassified Streptomyces TaxID=2593676 RepID=UPI0024BA5313|nr:MULTISPECIES: DUF6528 family protein [unclassified Streptomyces]MDJ0344058.1 DUF6528 family protein [Streptomyces sp. PH10-H1]MDJ0368597.1 DUF6528 family protein [Streptomyces sp. H10-C2]